MSEIYIRSSRPFFSKEEIARITTDISKALEEGKLRNGPNLRAFEKLLADYLNAKHVIALDSDSSGFEIALQFLGAKDREVIVCTNSFISVPNSVVYAGGKVVFADIRDNTLSMNPRSLEQKITGRTAGIIVTHISGFPNPDLKEITEICRENGLFLIEDATHALGATVNGEKVGTFGDAAVLAFTPTKILTTGEGGGLVTDNKELADFAKYYSYYGSGLGKTNFVNIGRHMIMPEISAIIGIHQFREIREFITKRNQVADDYNQAFENLAAISTITTNETDQSSFYKFPIILHGIDKTAFVRTLSDYGVETGSVFYPPCHMQPFYAQLIKDPGCPVSEAVLSRTITLPIHAALAKKDVLHVITTVKTALKRAKLSNFHSERKGTTT